MLVIDDPQRGVGHRVEDLLGVEAPEDHGGDVLQQVLALLEQDLPTATDVDEPDDGRRGENPGEQAHRIAQACDPERVLRGEKVVIGHEGEGHRANDRRTAAVAPADRADQ